MTQIYRIEPSRVIHELILKPLGTYLIRYSTENDDIAARITSEGELKSNPHLVLSVRANENEYCSPVMNYYLPSHGLNEEETCRCALEYYKTNPKIYELPELIEECLITTDETDWKIDPERFQTEYILMYQSQGRPLRTEMISDTENGFGQMKVFKKAMNNNEQEFSILKSLSYFHIVTFFGITSESNQIKHLILADHGASLKSIYPSIRYYGDLMGKQLAMIGYQIACGMMYLELKDIIHRDLHAENILIDDRQFIRIADFEHAISKDCAIDQEQELGFKKRRLAPECLPSLPEDGEQIDSNEILWNEFSSKSDVWAYGLIFMDLTIGTDEYIYPDIPMSSNDVLETMQMIQYVKEDCHIHEKPEDCPTNLYNILRQCWKYDREERISFENVRNEMLNLFKSISK